MIFATYQRGEPARLHIGPVWAEVSLREAMLISEQLQKYLLDEIQKSAPRGPFTTRRSGGISLASAGDGTGAGGDGGHG